MGERLVCTEEAARSTRVRSTRPSLRQILLASGAGISAALMLLAGLNAVLVTLWLRWAPPGVGLPLEAGAGFWWLLTAAFAVLTWWQVRALQHPD